MKLIKFDECYLYDCAIQGFDFETYKFVREPRIFIVYAIVGGKKYRVHEFKEENLEKGWELVDQKIDEIDAKIRGIDNSDPYR